MKKINIIYNYKIQKMKYKIGDEVYFLWNFSNYPCKIINFCENNIYLVEFPIGSIAGSIQNPRQISEYYLEIINKEIKKINIII